MSYFSESVRFSIPRMFRFWIGRAAKIEHRCFEIAFEEPQRDQGVLETILICKFSGY